MPPNMQGAACPDLGKMQPMALAVQGPKWAGHEAWIRDSMAAMVKTPFLKLNRPSIERFTCSPTLRNRGPGSYAGLSLSVSGSISLFLSLPLSLCIHICMYTQADQ